MDRFAEKQALIIQSRNEIIACYPALWDKITSEWKQPGRDQAWLTYSANYLFRTNNVRWALDPLVLSWRLREAAAVDVSILADLSFVLLTHSHQDHLDLNLLSGLKHLPIIWVVPEPILERVTQQAGIARENIIVPKPLQPIELKGIRIVPFDGLHWQTEANGTLRGVAATGYMVEFSGKRWLFPGDTRTYAASQLPAFGPVDGLFAHLWLGRGCALVESAPLLEAFCRFCIALQPSKIVLTHLQEFGRDADDFWDETHLPMVLSKFQEIAPEVSIIPTLTGRSIFL